MYILILSIYLYIFVFVWLSLIIMQVNLYGLGTIQIAFKKKTLFTNAVIYQSRICKCDLRMRLLPELHS